MSEIIETCLPIVQRIFSNWTALKIAVEHGMGTSEEAQSFCQYIAEMLSMNDDLHYSDIALELEDFMDLQFNIKLEDNSEDEVAKEIHRFYQYVRLKDAGTLESEIQKLPALQSWITNTKVLKVNVSSKQNDSDDDDSDENDDNKKDSSSNCNMEVDEDGWSVIRRKKK